LSFDDGREADAAGVRQVLAEEQVEHAALHVAGVAGEQAAVLLVERLPHFLQQHAEERGLELAGRLRDLGGRGNLSTAPRGGGGGGGEGGQE
jgi:hypothetical protein